MGECGVDLGLPIATGNTAAIYLLENKVVKVFDDRLPDWEAAYEAQKQRFAYACGLPVPWIIDVTHVDGKPAIVMEYVNGPTLGSLMQQDLANAEAYLSLSIVLQRRVHAVDADSLEPMKDRLSRQIQGAPGLDSAVRARLLDGLNLLPFEKKLCHGDFHVFNLVQTGRDIVILDWVTACAGTVCADVYRTYLLYFLFSPDLAGLYLRLYCDACGVRREDVFAWAPFVAAARLSEGVSSEDAEKLKRIVSQYV
jgi:aminoglycoside phosphotransferase (APT) family kinase protein